MSKLNSVLERDGTTTSEKVTHMSEARKRIVRSRTNGTLRMTVPEYREFAEIAKAHGSAMRLFDKPSKIIGLAGGIEDTFTNAASGETRGSMTETPLLLLCTSIDMGMVRSEGNRPECDVSRLTDAEMYRFWLYHEIGHRAHNYPLNMISWDCISKPELKVWIPLIQWCNELLADRWAWERVCSGPMPLTKSGKKLQATIAAALDHLDGLFGKPKNYAKGYSHHIEAGQYRGIPIRMLARPDAADWIGPDIHPNRRQYALEREARERQTPSRMIPEGLSFGPLLDSPIESFECWHAEQVGAARAEVSA